MHNDDTVDSDDKNKPKIISYYNSRKLGFDNLDYLFGLYTCKRNAHRWPMTVFFNIIETAAVAAYVIWCSKHDSI